MKPTRHKNAKLTRAEVARLLHRYEMGEQLKQLAAEAGVHRTTLSKGFDDLQGLGR